jgi:hypothetical protein
VDQSPGGPRLVDQAHGILSPKINLKFDYSENFAKRPLRFFEIKPQSTKFQEDPWFLKIILNLALATSRNYRQAPITSSCHISVTATPNSVILAPKFSESLTLSFYAFI